MATDTGRGQEDASPIRSADLFHTGIVVDDLASAQEEFGHLLGLTWLTGGGEVPMLLEDGPRTVTMAYAYSAEGPHHLELLQSVPGTVWTVSRGGQAHHVGYWSDDVEAATAYLSSCGLPRVVNLGSYEDDEFPTGVYHQARNGLYIEILNRELKPVIFGTQS
jgi:Glyoxalase/Bleomycin resistance protein/Dioxygenase superfamily